MTSITPSRSTSANTANNPPETQNKASLALLLAASTGCALTVLDTNVVGIVLPTIASELKASFADIEWVISAYVLCFTALLLPAGALADRIGRKRLYLIGLAVFSLASVACGLAPTASALYIARAVQGVGAALLLAPALAIIGHGFREEKARARAWAIWGAIMGLTMVLAPLIGGAINAWWGWRWAFHINAPICVVLAIAVMGIVPESRDPTPRAFDFSGITLFASAMFCLTWALIAGPEYGWLSLAFGLRLLAGAVLFATFITVEKRRTHPMLDLALFQSRPFVGAIIAMFAYAASAQVMASLLPLFLQNARGLSALQAGVGMLPFALAMLIMPFVGRSLGRRLVAHQILSGGLALVACGNLLMVLAATRDSTPLLMLAMAVLGSGGGLLNGETTKAIMGTVPAERAGMASGISTTSRFSGILLGFAGLGAVLGSAVRQAASQAMASSGLPTHPETVERIVAGDFTRAAAAYSDSATQTVLQLAHHSYGVGFSHAFVAAALLAALASWLVYRLMHRPAQA